MSVNDDGTFSEDITYGEIAKAGSGKAGSEAGGTGLRVSAGVIEEEFLTDLQGGKAVEVYREMSNNDPTVGAVLFAIDKLMRQVEWHVEQGEGQEADMQFVEECMEDMSHSWADFISELMSMLPYGFSVHEIVYKPRKGPADKTSPSRFSDGKVGWRKLPIRSQDTIEKWSFDDNGGLKGIFQKVPGKEITEIPMEKLLLFRTSTTKNNPEGKSVLRTAYRPWYYKKRIEQIEGTGIERDLAGFPKIWVDPRILRSDATNEDRAVLAGFQNIGKNIKRDKQEYIILPSVFDADTGNRVYDVELMSGGGTRQFDTSAIIQRYDQRIAMCVLADFILLGHEKVGSFALSSDKTDLFAVALGAWLDAIEDVLNRFLLPRLFELNGMNLEKLPTIKHGDVEAPDLTALASYIGALVSAGVPLFPDQDLEDYLREAGGLPEQSEEAKAAADLKREQSDAAAQAQVDQQADPNAPSDPNAPPPPAEQAIRGQKPVPAPPAAPQAPVAKEEGDSEEQHKRRWWQRDEPPTIHVHMPEQQLVPPATIGKELQEVLSKLADRPAAEPPILNIEVRPPEVKVDVHVPENQTARSRIVHRDDDGNITKITEE